MSLGLVTNSGGSVTGESFAYDANGNNSALTVSDDNIVTSDGTYSYVYDEEPADHTYCGQWNSNDVHMGSSRPALRSKRRSPIRAHRWGPQPEPSLRSATIPWIGESASLFSSWSGVTMLALTAGSPIQRLNGTFSQPADSHPITSTMASMYRSNYARSPTKARRHPTSTAVSCTE